MLPLKQLLRSGATVVGVLNFEIPLDALPGRMPPTPYSRPPQMLTVETSRIDTLLPIGK